MADKCVVLYITEDEIQETLSTNKVFVDLLGCTNEEVIEYIKDYVFKQGTFLFEDEDWYLFRVVHIQQAEYGTYRSYLVTVAKSD